MKMLFSLIFITAFQAHSKPYSCELKIEDVRALSQEVNCHTSQNFTGCKDSLSSSSNLSTTAATATLALPKAKQAYNDIRARQITHARYEKMVQAANDQRTNYLQSTQDFKADLEKHQKRYHTKKFETTQSGPNGKIQRRLTNAEALKLINFENGNYGEWSKASNIGRQKKQLWNEMIDKMRLNRAQMQENLDGITKSANANIKSAQAYFTAANKSVEFKKANKSHFKKPHRLRNLAQKLKTHITKLLKGGIISTGLTVAESTASQIAQNIYLEQAHQCTDELKNSPFMCLDQACQPQLYKCENLPVLGSLSDDDLNYILSQPIYCKKLSETKKLIASSTTKFEVDLTQVCTGNTIKYKVTHLVNNQERTSSVTAIKNQTKRQLQIKPSYYNGELLQPLLPELNITTKTIPHQIDIHFTQEDGISTVSSQNSPTERKTTLVASQVNEQLDKVYKERIIRLIESNIAVAGQTEYKAAQRILPHLEAYCADSKHTALTNLKSLSNLKILGQTVDYQKPVTFTPTIKD